MSHAIGINVFNGSVWIPTVATVVVLALGTVNQNLGGKAKWSGWYLLLLEMHPDVESVSKS